MANRRNSGLSFELSADQVKALRTIGGDRAVRVAGKLSGNQVAVEFVACNSPFVACNSPFAACNSPFSSCNSAFSAKK